MWVNILLAALAVYFVVDFVLAYRVSIGTVWQRSLYAAKGSATILWARFSAVVVASVDGVAQAADFVNAPQVANAITTYCTPKTVAVVMVASAVISEWARHRTLGK